MHERLPIQSETDIVRVRHTVRRCATEMGFSIVDQTKLVTAASELARNTLVYGRGGWMLAEKLAANGRNGLKLVFEDQGPGIVDLNKALTDGYTTGGGLGLGLSGAKRLVNDFAISTKVGEGTRVEVTRWK